MSKQTIIYLVLALAGVGSISLWIGLIATPVLAAYARVWEKLAAAVLSIYVLASFVVIGGAVAALIVWNYAEL